MVKQVEYLKNYWKKNDDDKGGAQDETIVWKHNDEIVIHSQTKKHGRMWASVHPNELLRLMAKNYGLYEVIYNDEHKVYFDIDKKGRADDNFLSEIKKIIETVFKEPKYAISGSVTDEKTSYHIVLVNHTIYMGNEKARLKSIVKYFNTKNDAFDWKVYTKNRLMKCVNQSKLDGRVQEIIENDNLKDHLITCFYKYRDARKCDETLCLDSVDLPEEIKDYMFIEKSKKSFDISILPKLILKCPDDVDVSNLKPDEILGLLPLDETFDFEYTHLIGRFCYYNKIPLETFLRWVFKKHEKEGIMNDEVLKNTVIAKWTGHFERMDLFREVQFEKIKGVLHYFYPHMKKNIHLQRFMNSFDLSEQNIQKIETMSQAHFKVLEKFIIFNIGMGGGKTYQTVEYLKKNSGFCWIAPNKALAHNTHSRIVENKIKIRHYLEDTTKDKKKGSLKEHENMIIVANSLHYLDDKTYDVIVIDEIETLIDKWFGSFMSNKRRNWEVFLNIIRKANKVILLDAFITKKTINFVKSLRGHMIIYERIHNPITRTVQYVKDVKTMIQNMILDLKNGLKLFIFYPYKNKSRQYEDIQSMESLYELLKTETGTDGKFYNADIDEEIKLGLKDVNESWKDIKFLLTNSIITCGVNYEHKDFDKEYIFVSSFSVPRDVIQVSYRPRHITSGIINVCYVGRMTPPNTWEDDCDIMNCEKYRSMMKDIYIEKKSPIRNTFQLFASKAHYNQTVSKNVLDELVKKEIQILLKKYDLGSSYRGVEDVDRAECEMLESKLFSGEATMRDKYVIEKFHFRKKFKEETPADKLEEAWNKQYILFFDRLRKILKEKDENLFNKIRKHNKIKKRFLCEDFKKLEVDEGLLDLIFTQFKFKYLNRMSSKNCILKEIYNTYFGVFMIGTSAESKHVSFYINKEVDVEDWYEFIQKYDCYEGNDLSEEKINYAFISDE